MTYRLQSILEHEIRDKGMSKLFFDIEMPLTPILVDMQLEGISINPYKLNEMSVFIQEKLAILENNIQAALSQQSIDLDDAIDLRNVRNLKLANQLLKVKRKKKQERDQQMQQQNIQAQSQANQEAQQAAAQAEMQKNQQKMQIDAQLEQTKNQMKIAYLQQEVASKKELMQFEFELNAQMN